MKNGQKYAKEIQQMMNQDYYECSLWSVRNGKKASEECCHIPESFDPVSGSDEFCKKCLGESLEWLNQEYKDQILDDVEREYLSAVIKPFRKKVDTISKFHTVNTMQYIYFQMKDNNGWTLPLFKKGTMYKGMVQGKHYTLEELDL